MKIKCNAVLWARFQDRKRIIVEKLLKPRTWSLVNSNALMLVSRSWQIYHSNAKYYVGYTRTFHNDLCNSSINLKWFPNKHLFSFRWARRMNRKITKKMQMVKIRGNYEQTSKQRNVNDGYFSPIRMTMIFKSDNA